ncbi:type VII secretion protein EccE [Streptomyces sp. LP05-1]|uniref:Type VII secretion protein EccE n=1 Tax=Streptomyces pyxinae TaxID=2970734 RepID=A0ABT2CGG9_9ACTN|nr:type VII secretion protein EccE [Streptomyces sp. LP05-1]MCS0636500.1 type VII secretion protein EccE [Streptomyces sp. LP05-1]
MGTATRVRAGRDGGRGSGASRRRRGDGRPGGPGPRGGRRNAPGGRDRRGGRGAAPTGGGVPAAVLPRPLSGTSRLGPVPLRLLVWVEAGLAVAAVGVALGGPWLIPACVVGGLLALYALIRRRGQALQDWLASALALRSRVRGATVPDRSVDPSLAVLAEGVPALRPYPWMDRKRRTVGMIGDGAQLTAVVRVEAGGGALRPASGARALPLAVLADALVVDDIALESVQLVQHVRPAPAPHLPRQSAARLSYAPLQERAGAPAVRMTWVAVKLDPELCPEAVEARGGGLEGAQRCLVRLADHVASRVTGAGFQATVLDQEELASALALASCASSRLAARASQPDAAPQRRTAETSRVWRCDDRWHTTYAVGRWPELGRAATPLPRLVSLLTSVPAYATTVSLTLRQGRRRGALDVLGHVRVTGGSDTELVAVRRELEQTARSAKVGLVRLDREQLPGVLATLPLGGTR